ncbi:MULTISPECIES: hypothetical protein [Aerococcus]|uniref:hypothetical protein n=1 Tax=Aerococcus TaxID=1375 RepID=UPI0018A70CC6|nr:MULTISPECIES: hypothetical protein [Aerococcus]MCY3067593.1 hypothetical protein [Aerococcus mictus]MCY3080872.1 hypothetical protein [Aerococcus mictus]MDK8485477.1 hypothetical protein [Aerococcus urinae]
MVRNKDHPLKNLDLYLFYACEELKGKNVLYDQEEIWYYLQIAYKDFKHEFLTLINYDQDYTIQNLTITDYMYSTINLNDWLDNHAYKKIEGGSILIYNHSTNCSLPKINEKEQVLSLIDIYKNQKKELFDIYIVGKSNVYSFAENSYKEHTRFLELRVNKEKYEENYSNHIIKELYCNLISPPCFYWLTIKNKMIKHK